MHQERAETELERFKQDVAYYESHREELLEKHPEQWVAIFRGCAHPQHMIRGTSPYSSRLARSACCSWNRRRRPKSFSRNQSHGIVRQIPLCFDHRLRNLTFWTAWSVPFSRMR
jgi:hypothetical protein